MMATTTYQAANKQHYTKTLFVPELKNETEYTKTDFTGKHDALIAYWLRVDAIELMYVACFGM